MLRDVHLTVYGFDADGVLRRKTAKIAVLLAVNSKIGILRYATLTPPDMGKKP